MSSIVLRGSAGYEELRTRYFNVRIPAHLPAEIVCAGSTADVVGAVERAARQGRKLGVRSGGHLLPGCSLVQDGTLVDAKALNASIEYDEATQVLAFGPGCLSRDLADACARIGRFFPFGHSPTVAVGGFLLCGGQGWFMRGWGNTADSWIVKFEVVTADGRVVEASRECNQDLFWALRGSGQGAFGVVTRIWGRTIAARKIYQSTIVFNATKDFARVCRWMFEANDRTPKYGVDTVGITCYADKNVAPFGDEIKTRDLLMVVNSLAYADSLDEAATMLRQYDDLPEEMQHLLIARVPLMEKSWPQLFAEQDEMNPTGGNERWQCDSILNDPKFPRDEVSAHSLLSVRAV